MANANDILKVIFLNAGVSLMSISSQIHIVLYVFILYCHEGLYTAKNVLGGAAITGVHKINQVTAHKVLT
jgi:hypothetical protein